MSENYFFEIAIYRLSPQDFSQELEKIHKAQIKRLEETTEETSSVEFIEYMKNTAWVGWDYNDIIGWLKLYAVNKNHIKANYWFVNKRVQKGMGKKQYNIQGSSALSLQWHNDLSSIEIYNRLRLELESLKQDERFKRYHIDLTAFLNVGPFVDWHSLVSNSQR